MQSGLIWVGVFFAVLGMWYAFDRAAAVRRWSMRKRDFLSSLSEAAYVRMTRAVGLVSLVIGLVLIAIGIGRAG